MLTVDEDALGLEGLCCLCGTPHEDDSPGECRAAAERRRLGAELDRMLTDHWPESEEP
jgi:hypothetical protein